MTVLLALYIAIALLTLLLPGVLTVGPGLTAENALLLVITAALAPKLISGDARTREASRFLVPFVCFVIYAALSWAVASFIVRYERYDALETLKSLLRGPVAQLLVLAAFCLAPKDPRSAFKLLQWLLVCSVLANLITVGAAFGYVPLGLVEARDDGRLQGVMGEANQQGAFAAAFLPATAALALLARGVRRALWLGGVLIAIATIAVVGSRGALLALGIGAVVTAYMLRQSISLRQAMGTASVIALLAVVSVLLVASQFGGFLEERFIDSSLDPDLRGVSSGRLEFWADSLNRMMKAPWTLLTGFGWQVFWVLPFVKSPHNTYLLTWFSLGIPGLLCFGLVLFRSVRAVLIATHSAVPTARPHYVAFVVGIIALCVALFFVELYPPWVFIWAYIGLVLGTTMMRPDTTAAPARIAPAEKLTKSSLRQDAYGWVAQSKHQ